MSAEGAAATALTADEITTGLAGALPGFVIVGAGFVTGLVPVASTLDGEFCRAFVVAETWVLGGDVPEVFKAVIS